MKKIISILLSVLLIYAMIFYAAGKNEWVNKAFTIGVLVSTCFMLFTKSFKEKLPKLIKEPIVIALFSYLGIYIISMFYAKVGKMAFDEITKLILSMSIFVIALIAINKENIRFTLGFTAGILGILGLLNIDLAGAKILSYPFIQIVNKIVPEIGGYGIFLTTRIWTAFGNPNLLAPLMVVGIFVSAYMFMTSDNKIVRLFMAIMLTFAQIAFIACYSLGSILFFALSFIVFIVFMEKGCRLKTLFTMLFSFVVSAISLILIFFQIKNQNLLYITDVIMLIAGIMNWIILLEISSLFNVIKEKAKVVVAVFSILIFTIFGVYIIMAFNTTVPFVHENVTVKRGVSLLPGQYELQLDTDKEILMNIYSQNLEEAQQNKGKTLLKGSFDCNTVQKSFVVDSDVEIVYFEINTNGAILNKIEVLSSEGQLINIPLKYRFIPEFIVNRIQGLRANNSMLLRMVFWQDGLKLFANSPIFGNGIGSFETEVNSVRTLSYETKYPHNVGVRVLLETGLIGACIFVSLIILIYFALLKRDCEYKQLRATLLASFTMLIGHSFIEMNMNYAIIVSILFVLIAVIIVAFEKKEEACSSVKLWKVRLPIIVVSALFVTMYIANLNGQNYLLKGEKGEEVFEKLTTYMRFDPFNKADYLLSYLGYSEVYADNADKKKSDDSIRNMYMSQADETLTKLKDYYAYASCEYIEKYFIERFDIDTSIELSKLKLSKNRVDRDVWRAEFQYFETLMSEEYIKAGQKKKGEEFKEKYPYIIDYILECYANLQRINDEIYKDIRLHEKNTNLVARALKAKELLKKYDIDETIRLMDEFVYDSNIIVDDNNDGINENIKVAENNKNVTFKAYIKAYTVTRFRGEIEAENPSDITKVLVGGKPSELTIENNKVIFDITTAGEGNTEVKIQLNDAAKLKRVTLNKELEMIF